MTAVNGAVVWAAKYSSFGEVAVDNVSTVENNLRFPGQYYDDETELYYNYHRYYDFKIARYLNLDPIGLSGGLNLFIYSNQNSINFFDPFGLFCRIEGTPGIGPRIGDTWIESQKIGYWNAMLRKTAWEIFKIQFKVPPIPGEAEDKMTIFKYRVRYTEYERRLIVTDDFYVCYDDCTKQVISREHIGQGNFGKSKVVILNAYEAEKYIGDSKEFNRNDDVNPLIIEF
jgi:RHS repeat-associated protein